MSSGMGGPGMYTGSNGVGSHPVGIPLTPVFLTPIVEIPEIVSCSDTQARFPMAGLNCWKLKVSVLALVGAMVMD